VEKQKLLARRRQGESGLFSGRHLKLNINNYYSNIYIFIRRQTQMAWQLL
jgi:hypothetical protein